jgi:hypothetical protein
METSVHTTSVDELEGLAGLQGPLHHQITSDRIVLETLEHLT